MEKTKYELEKEILEVLSKKRGKKMTLKDMESMFDVYFGDGVTYECYLKTVWVDKRGCLWVNVESAQGHGSWSAEFDTISICGCQTIARQLKIAIWRKPTMQESYDIICEHYECLKDSIREYVKEHADEHGILILEDKDDASRPYVVTTEEGFLSCQDLYTECRCIALRVVDGCVQFCAVPSFSFDEDTQYESSVLAGESNSRLWYMLDWDCANPFQYNIERIAYYLTTNE